MDRGHPTTVDSDIAPSDPGTLRESATCHFNSPHEDRPLRFIDLFCGCGGFTLGMVRAGFECLAAIDFDEPALATLRTNLPVVQHVLQRDLTRFQPKDLAAVIGTQQLDVVVGGPPCQGFSTARQVDGTNHGKKLIEDPRRNLYREFLRYVDFFQPRIFIMENVLGLRSAAGGEYFTRVQKEARNLGNSVGRPGYRVHAQIEDAWELGVPQKRRRQLIIGVRNDLPGYFLPDLKPAPRARPHTSLGDAIGDLPIVRAGGGEDERDYDLLRREKSLLRGGKTAENYLQNVLEVERAEKLTNHVARPHNERDLRDFGLLREGENSATAMRDRGVVFEFPYDKSSFKDRYTRQSRSHPCSTIVAHLSKDGLMFVHPTQARSLTPREAARVQSFPDWFRFPKARTHSFRQIGNAVPPLIAEAIGLAVQEILGPRSSVPEGTHHQIPTTLAAAACEIENLVCLNRQLLRRIPTETFLRGWHALLFMFPGLHPDNAIDHGDCIELTPSRSSPPSRFEKLMSRRYARSGWPVALESIGDEAWRRFKTEKIGAGEFYCVDAQRAGLFAGRDAITRTLQVHSE